MSDGTYVVASESCALAAVGADFVRDILPGEILVFHQDGVESRREHCGTQKKKTCIFEYIYFSRPDSVIDGVSVHESRRKAGELLAERYPAEADIVIGVPDSGLDAALGFAEKAGIPYGIGLIKNKYIRRTFISPGQRERLDQVRIKLSPVKSVIEGKRVILIDDSIVRCTQLGETTEFLYQSGAKEVHIRPACPPLLFGCPYLNFSRSTSELDLITRRIIRDREGDNVSQEILDSYADPDSQNYAEMIEEIRKRLNFTTLRYHRLDDLVESVGISPCKLCTYCWNGKH